MEYLARVEVSLKPGHSDPEGETTKKALLELNYLVRAVNVSKVYTIRLEAADLKSAKQKVDEICRRLLANPVKDSYRFEIEEVK
jgi:phosphoribosylformylglycinamidine synthase